MVMNLAGLGARVFVVPEQLGCGLDMCSLNHRLCFLAGVLESTFLVLEYVNFVILHLFRINAPQWLIRIGLFVGDQKEYSQERLFITEPKALYAMMYSPRMLALARAVTMVTTLSNPSA
jgi:hypothetical protein